MHPWLNSYIGHELRNAGRVLSRNALPEVEELIDQCEKLRRARYEVAETQKTAANIVEILACDRLRQDLGGLFFGWANQFGPWPNPRYAIGREHWDLASGRLTIRLPNPANLRTSEPMPDNLLLLICWPDLVETPWGMSPMNPETHLVYDIGGWARTEVQTEAEAAAMEATEGEEGL